MFPTPDPDEYVHQFVLSQVFTCPVQRQLLNNAKSSGPEGFHLPPSRFRLLTLLSVSPVFETLWPPPLATVANGEMLSIDPDRGPPWCVPDDRSI